jgi:ankyrin repeat protein
MINRSEKAYQYAAAYPHDALQGALYRGRTRVAIKLLKSLPNVNIQGGHFQNALQAACMGGHYALVKKLLDLGADPNTIGRYGTPLKAACYTGRDNIVELLIATGAVVNSREGNALNAAASRGHFSTVKVLMKHFFAVTQDDNNKPRSQMESLIADALMSASRGGHCDVLTYLLENGARKFASQALEQALEMHNHETARILIENIGEISDYCRYGGIPCSAETRDAWIGSDFEEELRPPQWRTLSERMGARSASRLFLEHELVDLEDEIHESLYRGGNSLGGNYPHGKEYIGRLMAVRSTASEAEALLSRGIEMNGRISPSPIEIAVKVGNSSVTALLLERGAELNSALQMAVYNGKPEMVRLIFQKRPNTEPDVDTNSSPKIFDRDIKHRSALALAVNYGDEIMVALLLQYKSTSKHPGPGPGMCEAVEQKDKRKLNMILESMCTPPGVHWSSEEQGFIASAVRIAIRSHDQPILEMILGMTKALEGDRKWIFEAMAHAAAELKNLKALEYIHDLASLTEKVAIAGSILKARAEEMEYTFVQDDDMSEPSGNEENEASVTSWDELWDEIAVQRKRPYEKEDMTLARPCDQVHVFKQFVLPYKGFEGFKTSLQTTFHMLVDEGQYNAGVELLRRYPEVDFVTPDPAIVQTALKPKKNLHRYINGKRGDSLLALVRLMIERGASVNSLDEHAKAPLYYACSKGLEGVFFLLLEAGADCNVLHTNEPKDSSEGDTDSGPALQMINLLQLTLRHIDCQVDRHERLASHTRWARIVFKLADAGLKCKPDEPGFITLFESACNLNLVDDLKKMMAPATWNDKMSIQPDQYFLTNSSGLHIALSRANQETIALLLKHRPDLSLKRYFPSEKEDLTPLQASLKELWYRGDKKTLYDTLEQLVDNGVPDEDAQALLRTYLDRDDVERARGLLQRGIKVESIPAHISADALSLLLEDDYRALVNLETLKGTVTSIIKSSNETYDSISKRLDVLEALGISLPSAGVLLHALLGRVWPSTEGEEAALLDRLMQQLGHKINDLFPCKDCGSPINLLSLAYSNTFGGRLEIYKAILERGADIDCPDLPYSALVMACRGTSTKTQVPIARMLLERGADVHGVRKTATQSSSMEQTPLMYAVASKNIELITLLIEHGADVNRGFIAPLSK